MENKHMLVETHIGLVNRMAKQLMKKNSNCDWLTEDDLLGAGYEALAVAARAYEDSREASFKTYATTCIKNAMLAEIRNMFPVKVNDKHLKIVLIRSSRPMAMTRCTHCLDCWATGNTSSTNCKKWWRMHYSNWHLTNAG